MSASAGFLTPEAVSGAKLESMSGSHEGGGGAGEHCEHHPRHPLRPGTCRGAMTGMKVPHSGPIQGLVKGIWQMLPPALPVTTWFLLKKAGQCHRGKLQCGGGRKGVWQQRTWIYSKSFKKNFIVVQLQLPEFCPYHSPPPQSNPHPSLASTFPLSFVHVSSIIVPQNPSPITPSHLPSAYSQFVLNFNVSSYILLACLFCCLGSTYR